MRIVTTALVVGIISFFVGFIGGLTFDPNSYTGPVLGFFVTGPSGTFVGALIGIVRSAIQADERRIRAELWWLGFVWGDSLAVTLGLNALGELEVVGFGLQGLVVASGAFLLFSSTTRKNLPQPARKYGPVLLGVAVLMMLISMSHAYADTVMGLWVEWLIIAGVAVGACLFIGTRASD